ncbi:MAG: hypothetical protein GEV11_08730 [Streptosporangiales bacterium]|nr:hypothetical protein [Streptosporangiales bacterium]
MNSTWMRGSRAPRIAALIIAALPTLLMWVASRSTRSEEVAFGWFAYTPLSMDLLITVMNILSWSMTLIQLAVPALVAVLPLLFVRRWTAWGAGAVLLAGGLVLGGVRLLLGSTPAAVTPQGEFSPLFAALALAACYVIAAALLFLAAIRLSPAEPATAGNAAPTTTAVVAGEGDAPSGSAGASAEPDAERGESEGGAAGQERKGDE